MASATTIQPDYQQKFALDFVKDKKVSSRQELTMELIASAHKNDGDGFLVGVPFPNFSDGDGIGPSTGQVLMFKADARVHAADFGPEVMGITATAEIRSMAGGLTDVNLQSKMHVLHEIAPTYAPAEVAASLECRDPKTFTDARKWTAELGPTGYAGFAKATDGRKDTYYLVVHASPDMINSQLKQYVRNSPSMTYANLLRDPLWSYAREMVKRNAQRVMADIRSEFRLDVGGMVYHDCGSVTKPHEIAPNMLTPDEQHYTSSVRRIIHDGQECVAVYNQVIPAENCASRLVLDQGPWNGFIVFNTHNTTPALGYPAGTRVVKHPSKTSATDADARVIAERAPFFTWVGKSEQAGDKFPAVLLDGLHESTDSDEHFIETMKTLGLNKTTPVAKMLPVAMKVAAPHERRLGK